MSEHASLVEESFRELEARFAKPAEELLDGFIVAMQDFDTETLRGIAEYRDEIQPGGWMTRIIREYLSVWRQG